MKDKRFTAGSAVSLQPATARRFVPLVESTSVACTGAE
jgi:hypothetical protein